MVVMLWTLESAWPLPNAAVCRLTSSFQTEEQFMPPIYLWFRSLWRKGGSHFCSNMLHACDGKADVPVLVFTFLFVWKNFLNSAFGLSWGTECKMISFILTWGFTIRNSENPWEWLLVPAIAAMGRTQVSSVLLRLGQALLEHHCSLFSSCE